MRRAAVLKGMEMDQALLNMAMESAKAAPLPTRLAIAGALQASGHSQRSVSEITGLSRDTIRKHTIKPPPQKGSNGATRE